MSESSNQLPDETSLHDEVKSRFGVLPNFFRLAPEATDITSNLWGFAKFGYLDNPLPPLFKERLFVSLSRFCEVRYCISRHLGFLIGLGRPSGDSSCPPETIDQAVRLLRRPLPRGEALEKRLRQLEQIPVRRVELPEPETSLEEAVFDCATHVFLQTSQAARSLEALRRAFDEVTLQHILVFLAFIRTAHFWTQVHPELKQEQDITDLLKVHEALTECVLHDPAADSEVTEVLLEDLSQLRKDQERAELLRVTLASIGDAVITTDAEQRVTFLNDVAASLTGWTLDEAVGKPVDVVFNIVKEDSTEKVENPVDRVLRLGTTVGLANHTELISKDGSRHPIQDSGSPIRVGKEIVGVVLVFRDVTEQRRSERALHESEENFRNLADNMSQFAWMADQKGDLFWYNQRWFDYTGTTLEDMKGWGWRDVHHPDHVDRVVAKIQHSWQTGEVWDDTFPLRGKDGNYRWFLSRAQPIRNQRGEVIRWFGTNTDIEDLKLAEESTKKRSDQIRRLAEVAIRIGTATDVTSVLETITEEARYVIDAHQAVSSLTVDQGWGQAINAVSMSDKYEMWRDYDVSPDDSGIYSEVCRLNQSMRFTQAELEENPHWKNFGEYEKDHPPIRGWLAAPLVGRGGRNLGLIQLSDKAEGEFTPDDQAVLVQLARMASVAIENARLVENLVKADHQKDEFLATLAHELRNPLAPIRMGLEILKLEKDDPAVIDEVIATMERQTQQLITLVDDLLEVSRITRGKLQLRKCRVSIAEIVQSAVEASEPAIEEARHQLTVAVPQQPLYLFADPNRLSQVLSNLLSNAIKYTPEGGRIEIAVEQQDNEISVSVKDNGLGIPAEMQSRIFEIFTQIERPMERGYTGLGIGLTLVKSLIEMHGGSVDVSSQGEGQGSEFKVRLPLQNDLAGETPARAGPVLERDSQTKRRVLVVDDNRAAADTLSMVVKMLGNEVRTANDGQEAVDTAAKFLPDVIIMDIGMPRMDGYEAAQHIRQQPWGEQMMLVALTGWGQAEDKRRTREAGFNHHLVKPAEPQELQAIFTELDQKST